MLSQLSRLPRRRIAFAHHDASLPVLVNSGGRERLSPHEPYAWDNHQRHQDAVVLQVTLKGCGRLSNGHGDDHRIEEGRALLVALPSPTFYGRWRDEEWDFAYLNLSGSWTRRAMGPLIDSSASILDLRQHGTVAQAMARCLRFGLAGDHSATQASAQGYALLMALLEAFPAASATAIPDAVRDALRRIDATFADPQLNVDRLATESGLSRAYFARLFRRHAGNAPHEVLTRRRVDHAEQLLRSTALDLNEIARRSGFSNASYLCHVFRRERGRSPASFRP